MIKEYQLRKLQNSYEVTLYYKGVKVRVAFTGGNVYNGTLPKFRTDNLFKMKAIEASELFKNKEVVLLRVQGKPEDNKAAVRVQPKKSNIGKPVMPKSAVVASEPKPAPAPEPKPEPEPAPVEAVEEEGPKEIVYDNLGEAISYIAQNFQMEVRTEKEARDVLKAHGIKPVIKKG